MPGPKTNRNKKLTDKQPLPAAATSESEECKFDQEKFEAELSWCIEQLQKGLKSKKLTAKQEPEYIKALHVLMSTSTPFIRKRQVMRLSFGDYRAKIAEEEEKFNRTKTQVTVAKGTPCGIATFLKKHTNSRKDAEVLEQNDHAEIISRVMENVNVDDAKTHTNFKFNPSDNSFRFNFN